MVAQVPGLGSNPDLVDDLGDPEAVTLAGTNRDFRLFGGLPSEPPSKGSVSGAVKASNGEMMTTVLPPTVRAKARCRSSQALHVLLATSVEIFSCNVAQAANASAKYGASFPLQRPFCLIPGCFSTSQAHRKTSVLCSRSQKVGTSPKSKPDGTSAQFILHPCSSLLLESLHRFSQSHTVAIRPGFARRTPGDPND